IPAADDQRREERPFAPDSLRPSYGRRAPSGEWISAHFSPARRGLHAPARRRAARPAPVDPGDAAVVRGRGRGIPERAHLGLRPVLGHPGPRHLALVHVARAAAMSASATDTRMDRPVAIEIAKAFVAEIEGTY